MVAGTNVRRVVVRRPHEGRILYYVFARDVLLARLGGKKGVDLQTALDLHETQAAPLEDADSDEETSPNVCVVHRDGELIGYYDADLPVNTVRSSRSPDGVPQAGNAGGAAEGVALRHVHGDFPGAVPVGETVSLLVSLRRTSAGGTEVAVVPTIGVIDVVVRARKGFALDGRGEHQLRVTDEDESLPVQFKLRATDVGPGKIEVYCLQGGTPLGSVTVHSTVLPAGQQASGQSVGTSGILAPSPAAEADLILLVSEWRGPHGTCLGYTLKAADPAVELNFKQYYSEPFTVQPQAYFRDFYFLLDQRLQEAGGADADAQLAAYGRSLFDDLFPTDRQVLLWGLRDRIKTVQVLSNEPWIPWELVKLTGQNGDSPWSDGPFLCQAFRLTRWFPGVPRRPRLRLRKMAVVAPAAPDLPNSVPERNYLLGLAVPDRLEVTEVSAEKDRIVAELLKGVYDGWHFVGHGAADRSSPDESHLKLVGRSASPRE